MAVGVVGAGPTSPIVARKMRRPCQNSLTQLPDQNKATFNLPDMATGESIRGTTKQSYQGQRDETGGLPNITGRGVSTEYAYKTAPSETSGAFRVENAGEPDRGGPQSGNSYIWIWWNFDASRSSNAYGKYNKNTVEPYGYWMYHIIKY